MVNFLQFKKVYFLISALVIAAGIYSIIQWGFIYSIDFVGGTNLEYRFSKHITNTKVKDLLSKNNVDVIDIQRDNLTYKIRTKVIDEKKEVQVRNDLTKMLDIKITVLRTETVGPVIGGETIRKTAIATLIAVLGILLYISYAFKNINFAMAAIIALFHDVLVVIGSYSLLSHFFGAELDTLFVTALLTTMSFSVHDTIVVFDKIREYRRISNSENIEAFANRALTETLVRSLNNSMTIIFMLLALVLLGGSTIRYFAATLLIGTITGTYSSPFVATPVAVLLEKMKRKP